MSSKPHETALFEDCLAHPTFSSLISAKVIQPSRDELKFEFDGPEALEVHPLYLDDGSDMPLKITLYRKHKVIFMLDNEIKYFDKNVAESVNKLASLLSALLAPTTGTKLTLKHIGSYNALRVENNGYTFKSVAFKGDRPYTEVPGAPILYFGRTVSMESLR